MACLADTRLGLHFVDGDEGVTALGQLRRWADGEVLCRLGAQERELHVVLDGYVDHDHGQLGPGAHVGELGFVLGAPRTAAVTACGPATTWTVRFVDAAARPEAGARLLEALAAELPTRLAKLRPEEVPTDRFCDHEDPTVRALAASLTREDAARTATAIWAHVMHMPYRFGIWWQRASSTLAQGWGMCTTKANLQVSLMRAAGLEAGFVEVTGDASLILPVVPVPWRATLRPQIRHIFAAVRLDGRWHAADASFTRPVLGAFAGSFPQLRALEGMRLEAGSPFHPVAVAGSGDPWAVEVFSSIDAAMARRSRHDVDRLETMNLILDRLQGAVVPPPRRLRVAVAAAASPSQRFAMAHAAALGTAAKLREAIVGLSPT